MFYACALELISEFSDGNEKYKKEAAPLIGNSLLKCSMNYIGILPSQVLT